MVGERDYSQMSPQELNRDLGSFYEALPKVLVIPRLEDMSEEEINESKERTNWFEDVPVVYRDMVVRGFVRARRVLERRSKSEYRELFLKNLENLLGFSYLLPGSKKLAMLKFEYGYLSGFSEESPIPDDFFSILLDLHNPESGGIFEEDFSKEIQRKIIRYYLDREGYRVKVMMQAPDSIPSSFPESDEKNLISRIKSEYIEKYGDEP